MALDALEEKLARSSRKRYFALCDVGDAAAVDVFVALAGAALGGLDVLVSCASALAPGNDAEAWSASLNVDLLGSDHPPLMVDTGYGLRGRGEFFFVNGHGVAEAQSKALVVVPALNGPEEGCAPARRQGGAGQQHLGVPPAALKDPGRKGVG